jgi:hypothetical protein
VTPFHPKGLFNPNLNTIFPGGLEGVDGLPSGHPNLNSGHPRLLENFSKGVLVVKVLPAPLRLEEVEDEAMENVEWLYDVREAPYVVALGTKGVIFSFKDRFAKEDERP